MVGRDVEAHRRELEHLLARRIGAVDPARHEQLVAVRIDVEQARRDHAVRGGAGHGEVGDHRRRSEHGVARAARRREVEHDRAGHGLVGHARAGAAARDRVERLRRGGAGPAGREHGAAGRGLEADLAVREPEPRARPRSRPRARRSSGCARARPARAPGRSPSDSGRTTRAPCSSRRPHRRSLARACP